MIDGMYKLFLYELRTKSISAIYSYPGTYFLRALKEGKIPPFGAEDNLYEINLVPVDSATSCGRIYNVTKNSTAKDIFNSLCDYTLDVYYGKPAYQFWFKVETQLFQVIVETLETGN